MKKNIIRILGAMFLLLGGAQRSWAGPVAPACEEVATTVLCADQCVEGVDCTPTANELTTTEGVCEWTATFSEAPEPLLNDVEDDPIDVRLNGISSLDGRPRRLSFSLFSRSAPEGPFVTQTTIADGPAFNNYNAFLLIYHTRDGETHNLRLRTASVVLNGTPVEQTCAEARHCEENPEECEAELTEPPPDDAAAGSGAGGGGSGGGGCQLNPSAAPVGLNLGWLVLAGLVWARMRKK